MPNATENAARLVEPVAVAEAATVLREAERMGTSVSIERDGGEIVLTTRSLDRVLEHEAGDLTATVEAGHGSRL